jgi:3alpha(or 20beta)-hydroxysteroid dehydrogenase
VLREATLEGTTLEEYRFIVDVMQTGVFLGMRSAAPSLRKAGGGSIVNISSTAGIVGYPGIFAYTAAKWAVRGMTKAAALDLAVDKIRVNSIHPGDTETPMIADFDYSVEAVPLKRFAKAEEIANLSLFLASDESQYITGTEHVIDGGLTAG